MSKHLQLKKENRLRGILQKTFEVLENRKQKQDLEEQRLRKAIKLLLEAEDDIIHPSTGINELREVLKATYKKAVYEYKRLTTDPEQRRAFLHAWEWFFKEAFSGDTKRRKAAVGAASKVKKQGFAEPELAGAEETEPPEVAGEEDLEPMLEAEEVGDITVKVDDKDGDGVIDTSEDLAPSVVPRSEEEKEEENIDQLTKPPGNMEKIGPKRAMKVFDETNSIVLRTFDELSGNDAENFYIWFFINMLGSERSGFEKIAGKPIVGHFQKAEEDLKNRGIEVADDLLPIQDEEAFNIPSEDFN